MTFLSTHRVERVEVEFKSAKRHDGSVYDVIVFSFIDKDKNELEVTAFGIDDEKIKFIFEGSK